MPTPDTITRGAGQAQRSAARLILTVAKYTGLTLAAKFLLLFFFCSVEGALYF